MKHGQHLYLMVGAVALAAILLFTGAIGSGWVLLLLLGACAAMMVFMMRSMGGGPRGSMGHGRPDDERTPTTHERLG